MHLIPLIDLLAAATLLTWVYLFVGRGLFWWPTERDDAAIPPVAAWPRVAVIMPARNEAAIVQEPVKSLLRQDYPGDMRLFLVDDDSADATAASARQAAEAVNAADRFTVVVAGPVPRGWTGKIWALNRGLAEAERQVAPDYVFLTDADTIHAPDTLSWLVAKAERDGLALTSLITMPCRKSFAERMLVPAFVYFFQMLFPPAWVNKRDRATAAAVGSCMLARLEALRSAGGLAAMRDAVIDDCTLARLMKTQGPLWIGVTERAYSIRPFPTVGDIRHMVSRYAYAHFHYSPLVLLGAVAGMILTYLAPPLTALAGTGYGALAGLGAWTLMAITFQPTLRHYRASPLWALVLPAIALIYLVFTLDSVYQHLRGRGGSWKGRYQANVSSRS